MKKTQIEQVIEDEDIDQIAKLYHWIANETWDKYGDKLFDFTADYHDDFILFTYGPPADLRDGSRGDTLEENLAAEWGLEYDESDVAARSHSYPLNDWNRLPEFLENMPDPHAPGRFESFSTAWQVSQLYRDYPGELINTSEILEEYQEWYKIGLVFPAINERMMALRDPAKLWKDLARRKSEVYRLGDALVEYNLGLIEEYEKLGMDGIWFSDDWGTQENIFISPGLWRELFKPWYKTLIEAVHAKGMHAFFHCCGKIDSIIKDFVDLDLDVLHLGQPYLMDLNKIISSYGDKLCLFGGIDVQKGLQKPTTQEVEDHVKKAVDLFGDSQGGYIASPTNSITPDTPLENIKAMYRCLSKCTVSS